MSLYRPWKPERQAFVNRIESQEVELNESKLAWDERYNQLLGQFDLSKSKLSESEERNNQYQGRINELESEREQILNGWEVKYNHLLEQFNQNSQLISDLEHEKGQLIVQIQQLTEDKEIANSQLENQLNDLQQLFGNSEQKFAGLQGNYEALGLEYNNYKDNSESQYASLQAEYQALDERFSVLTNNNTELKDELARYSFQIRELEVLISNLKASNDKLNEDLEQLQNRHFTEIEEMGTDADNYKSKFEQLLEASNNSSIIIAGLEKERDQMAADYDKSQRTLLESKS